MKRFPDGASHEGQPMNLAAAHMVCVGCGGRLHTTDVGGYFVHDHKAVPDPLSPGRCAICPHPAEPYVIGATRIGPHL
jgi:hypothetical protein